MCAYFQVDEAMLGSEWDPDLYSLSDFCAVLQDVVPDCEIVCVTGSYNGASNEGRDVVTDAQWTEAHNRYFA
jgi:hypothetical protein